MSLLATAIAGVLFTTSAVDNATISTHTHAHSEQQPDTLIRMDEVVISANRSYVNRNNVPMTISVVRRDEIEQSSESSLLPVLSQRVPGLFVTQRGVTGFGVSAGSAGTVNIRGVGQGDKVLMMFDGQPQWAGLFGHSLPDAYVASDVERVEVIRGPGSLLYGSNAMGGVVNVITRKQLNNGSTTQGRLMYGSFNTQKYMLNNGFKSGRFSSFVSINHDRTDGHRANSDFHITNGFAKAAYAFSEQLNLSANISLAGYAGTNPGMVTNPITDNTIDVLRGSASVAFENNFTSTNGAVRLFYNFGNHTINDGYYAGAQPQKSLFHLQDHNYGVLLYQSIKPWKRNLMTVGVDYKNWGGIAWNALRTGGSVPIIDKSVNETAGYLIMQQGVGRKVNFNAGLRWEHNSTFGNQLIPQAGVTYNPFIHTSFKAAISKGYRSPNIRELYMFNPANPNLLPESMINYEVSASQSFLNGALFAEVTAFLINGRNMIQTIRQDGRPINVNLWRFINRGMEAELHYHLNKRFTFSSNYSYLFLDQPRIAAPKHQFFLSANYTGKRLSVNLNTQYIGGLYVSASPPLTEDYMLLNARVAYRLGGNKRGVTLFVKGENLTNQRYSINQGFPMPGAIVLGGIDFRL